ncbi:hypothetical protein O206_04170 [Ochrobactrum sp. EGD-AQ16]|nr:hypothetical protein O206_04170 [Ochrobactrum sp. EGD-AQ16]
MPPNHIGSAQIPTYRIGPKIGIDFGKHDA